MRFLPVSSQFSACVLALTKDFWEFIFTLLMHYPYVLNIFVFDYCIYRQILVFFEKMQILVISILC